MLDASKRSQVDASNYVIICNNIKSSLRLLNGEKKLWTFVKIPKSLHNVL